MSFRQFTGRVGACAVPSLLLGALFLGTAPAFAIEFNSPETVDTGAVATSTTRDETASYGFGAWHAVYVNGDRAMIADRTVTERIVVVR